MDLQFTDEQRAIQDTLRDFIAKECPREAARDLDERQIFPNEWLGKLAALGFCGLNAPEDFGGGGENLLGSIIAIEEIAAMCPTLAGAFASVVLRGGRALSKLGSGDQKKKYLPTVAQGKTRFTFAATGSSETIQVTTSQDDYVLNGMCKFVPLADQVDYMIVLGHSQAGASFFIVDARSESVRAKQVARIGFRGAHLCQVSFSQARVSRADILGGEAGLNHGLEQLQTISELQQIETAACCLGIAQGAYDYAANYARERVQFGKRLAEFEAIQHMLVDIAVELRASRLLLYQVGSLADQGVPCSLNAAIAHLHAVERARRAALQCLHILGGYGYMMEYDAQRYVRDALALTEGSESSALLKNSIGALLGLAEPEIRK
jgi:alkylation response protein AidB-like acyl-CoA dehydrogenase